MKGAYGVAGAVQIACGVAQTVLQTVSDVNREDDEENRSPVANIDVKNITNLNRESIVHFLEALDTWIPDRTRNISELESLLEELRRRDTTHQLVSANASMVSLKTGVFTLLGFIPGLQPLLIAGVAVELINTGVSVANSIAQSRFQKSIVRQAKQILEFGKTAYIIILMQKNLEFNLHRKSRQTLKTVKK